MYGMEELSRTQTVLLCLLVSFVTSIGTGIITVSLIQEAPPGVTQTINQVVERTVERVVPGAPNTVTKEVTVVVKEEDLVIDAIRKNEKSLVRIGQNVPQGVPVVVALGLVVADNGTILVDGRTMSPDASYVAIFADSRQFPIRILSLNEPRNTAYVQVVKDASDAYTFVPAIVAPADSTQLGQSIISLGGKTQTQVAIGRVSYIENADPNAPSNPSDPTKNPVVLIRTDAPLNDGLSGTILLNLSGQLVGTEAWRPDAQNEDQFNPIHLIKREAARFFGTPQNNNP